MYGWIGTILRVNLTNRTVKKEPLDPALAKQYIGARAWGPRSCTTSGPAVDPSARRTS